jgi:hypothetical protein
LAPAAAVQPEQSGLVVKEIPGASRLICRTVANSPLIVAPASEMPWKMGV